MAKVELTVKQIINFGLWEKVCEYKGWDHWIVNEGRIDENEIVEFDDEFKKEEEIVGDKFIVTCPKCSSINTQIRMTIHDSYEVSCNDCGHSQSGY